MNIMVILGSSRESRRGEVVARWVERELKAREGITTDFVDVRELGLPFFDEVAPVDSLEGNFRHPEGKAWNERLKDADAFIFVTPEYNHSIPAVLKNAIDYGWDGWGYKPFSIVSYSNGSWGGVRAVEQLRLVGLGVRLLPMYKSVQIPRVQEAFDEQGAPTDDRLTNGLKGLVDELLSIAQKLKN